VVKELPDPSKLLRGSGNQTRPINLEGASTLAPEFALLIDEAIARNRVPFALPPEGPARKTGDRIHIHVFLS
jgi:hypothetical protein